MAKFNNAKNILVGASPLFLSTKDITTSGYVENMEPGSVTGVAFENETSTGTPVVKTAGKSYTETLNADSTNKFRNVGYTNNGLQITYNPSYGSVTVDQLLDTAKLFKETMEVMIATEMAEGTLENVLAVFGQSSATLTGGNALGLAAGALGEAPVERQLVAIGQAPTTVATGSKTERVYYGRRVLSVQQSQFSLARNAASTFPVTFRLLPDGNYQGAEYGTIVDRNWV
jgi:hypothetical protein